MENKATLDVLYKLKKEIERSDNDALISQIDHALDKTYRDQLSFSFIGHYSAGKSSLINYLLDEEILPSSPVPTTSNTVAVEISEEEAIQAYINQYQYVPLQDYKELRSINAKDVDIQSILLRVPHHQFKTRTVIQDTPGVDSRTRAHSDHTQRFLLNSDYIFFTVEYNHVESAHNLTLLKELHEMNIPLSLVINQVDKHNDEELSFESFLSRVKNTLNTWGVHPEHIFTTSIYDAPYNEVDKLKAFMHNVENNRHDWKQKYHERIIKNIETKQIHYLNDQIENELQMLDDASDGDALTMDVIDSTLDMLQKELHDNAVSRLHEDASLLSGHIKNETKSIVENAYLFPHNVKAPITEYLKFRAGEIKVSGIFGKKKKQEDMRVQLLNEVNTQMGEVLKSQIDSQVNTMLMNNGLSGRTFVYNWDDALIGHEPITTLSNDYVINYFDSLKSRISKDVTSQVLTHMNSLERISEESRDSSSILQDKVTRYTQIRSLEKLRASLETTQYRHYHIHLEDELEKLNFSEAVSYDFVTSEEEAPESTKTERIHNDTYPKEFFESLVALLEDYPRYSEYRSTIADKLDRLKHNKTNISVFGGFSAGKTTFINALMEERLLATSPNPTTATITEINDSTSEVVFKSAEDIMDMLKIITNQDLAGLPQYTKWVKRNFDSVKDVYKPFLKGLLEKYDAYESYLGSTSAFSAEEIITMIANDVDATFIHKAYVAIHNSFTERFNIVDSPGINSINQRHTNETKNIITDSDLIVYVSYYNHVFSASDEDFLRYIKSIKGDDFPIVFVINAIDLMKDASELESVVTYMRDSLTRLNISGTILPVSSMQAHGQYNAEFKHAKQSIIDLSTEQKETNQLKSLGMLYNQTAGLVTSNIKLYENQEEELARIEELRQRSVAELNRLDVFDIERITDVEIDILLNHMHKQLALKLYDQLKGILNTNVMQNKKYIQDNLSSIASEINQYLHVQIATSFNSIYRIADKEIDTVIADINRLLEDSRTVHTLEEVQIPWHEVDIQIDTDALVESEKELYKGRYDFKAFNDALLTLSHRLARTIDIEELRKDMRGFIRAHLEAHASHLAADIDVILESLGQPLETVSDADYKEDQALNHALKELTHAT